MRGRLLKSLGRGADNLRDSLAVGIEEAEIVLGVGMALFGSLAIPLRRLRVVPRDAVAVGVSAVLERGVRQAPANFSALPVL
jgi:hypothetical protein